MKKMTFAVALCIAMTAPLSASAEETPPHTIAVAGEAEILLPPDYATVEVGVITQGPVVEDALNENNAKMDKVIEAIRSLGIADADIHTSEFNEQPKYEKQAPNDYDPDALRPVVGYTISNKVTVTLVDMSKIAKVIDASVRAGANASGRIEFEVKNLTQHMDLAREAAIGDALHKAQVLTDAAHMKLGHAISITDNGADRSYNGFTAGGGMTETVIVTASRMPDTPILPGEIPISDKVTVLYSAK
ncbi:MAG: SIMPL domain-containing protein [Rhizomicrobium sp.]|jgi:uncharacterized protein YggE